jgi:hypothetical protein
VFILNDIDGGGGMWLSSAATHFFLAFPHLHFCFIWEFLYSLLPFSRISVHIELIFPFHTLLGASFPTRAYSFVCVCAAIERAHSCLLTHQPF